MRYRTKNLIFLLHLTTLITASFGVHGERYLNSGSFDGRGKISFLVGLKGGINFSLVSPMQRFSVLQGLDGTDAIQGEKDYSPFYRNTGYQYGFIGLLRFGKSLSLSLEPSFSTYAIRYSTLASWYNASDPSNRIEITMDFNNKLKYFEIPIVMRYELGSGNIRPYLAAGFFYGLLTGAPASVQEATVQYTGNMAIPLENSESTLDLSDNYINTRFAAFPGAGFFYDFSFMTIFAEADYVIGLHNVVDESARYSNQQSVGSIYHVPDDLRFNNLVINLGILFTINRRESGSAVDCPPFIRKR